MGCDIVVTLSSAPPCLGATLIAAADEAEEMAGHDQIQGVMA